jgi:predicted Zn-dependent peptidase
MPTGPDVAAVEPADVRALHAAGLVPGGAILTLVGDIDPHDAVALVEQRLGGWTAPHPARRLTAPPQVAPSNLELVPRAGSVQSQLRMSAPALARLDARYAALQLANLVFGGYFSSRWMENIREDKGYTYGAHSGTEFVPGGAVLSVETDVASDVTAAALLETRYELGRMVAVPPTADEIDAARRYAVGSLLISLDSQGGYASTLASLAADDISVQWLRDHPARLEAVTVEEVAAAAGEYFAPSAFTGVIVGDAEVVGPGLRALGGVDLP